MMAQGEAYNRIDSSLVYFACMWVVGPVVFSRWLGKFVKAQEDFVCVNLRVRATVLLGLSVVTREAPRAFPAI